MSITVIWGPPGSGKTRNSKFLSKKYHAKRVIDEWPRPILPQDGDLILTQSPMSAPMGANIIHITEALRNAPDDKAS